MLRSADGAPLTRPGNAPGRTSRRLLLIALAAGALVLVVVPTAVSRPGRSPYYKSQAHFDVTIQGTYTARGVVVDKNCSRPPPPGQQPQQITVTTTGAESLEFKSTRSVKLDAYRYLDNSVGAGTTGVTPITVTTTRTLTLTEPCQGTDPKAECGTKHLRLAASVISREKPLRLLYSLSDGPGRTIFPNDPFDFACRVPEVTWWGKLIAPPATLSAAKLFNPRLRTFSVSGAMAKSAHLKSATETTDSEYGLRYTVTLVRRAR